MKVVFMGTPHFAAYQLEHLINNGVEVVGVVTMPDKPMGRGMKLGSSAVKETAVKFKIPVLQPEKLKNEEFLSDLAALHADVFVVVAFRMLPKVVWGMPAKGTLNLHASLLPQYRGAAPINWAIINGETQTGVTTFFIQEEIDTGDMLLVDRISISSEDDAGTLHDKLMELGAGTILKTLKVIESGSINPVPQSLEGLELKSAPKIFKEACEIDWNKETVQVLNHIKGMSPYPTAWTRFIFKDGRSLTVKVFKAEQGSGQLLSGEFSSDSKTIFNVGTSNGAVSLLDIQLEGKKRMDIRSFLMGFDLNSLEKIG